ncbi:MAG: urate hydroxylase PuuD [Gammaproteobacteria bacterium]|nr:urate hydroxylase PuuD [Gammaproteobacteria bacterium]
MNPLTSIPGTIITGIVLAIAIIFGLHTTGTGGNHIEWAVWFHVVVGITWIGLLYYFNFVQTPAMAKAKADGTAGGISKHVAPRALLWFRWAAVLTWLSGVGALADMHILKDAFMFNGQNNAAAPIIGMGAWLGTIMLFNVWVLIWPNQKKILGIVPASDDEKAKAGKIALMASRINTALSIPMLLGMTAYAHGLPF